MSQKKVIKGEADWLMQKEALERLVDGRERTLDLTLDNADAYTSKLKKLL